MNAGEFVIGEFNVKNSLIVTDPCYKYDDNQILRNVKSGEWVASVKVTDEGSWGNRIAELRVCHNGESFSDYEFDREYNFEVSVDSGQAGFFDCLYYPMGESTGEYGELDTFYGKVCEMTISPKSAGVLSFGAVSSSGYGDGGYNLYTVKRNGVVLAAKIVFIPDEDEDEDDYYGEEV
jgi:hypothetical protein